MGFGPRKINTFPRLFTLLLMILPDTELVPSQGPVKIRSSGPREIIILPWLFTLLLMILPDTELVPGQGPVKILGF